MSRYLEERSGWIAGIALFLAVLQVIKPSFGKMDCITYLTCSLHIFVFTDSRNNCKLDYATHVAKIGKRRKSL